MDKFKFRKDISKNRFTNRVVNEWYKLSRCVDEGNTFESFTWRLEVFTNRKGV